MLDDFRRKLAKWIAPKPKKRVKKAKKTYDPQLEHEKQARELIEGIMNNKAYQLKIRRKQATVVGGE